MTKNQQRLKSVMFDLCYPAVLGTFFYALFPEFRALLTEPWSTTVDTLGKVALASLLVFHFIFDYLYTKEIKKYGRRIFALDFCILISLFIAYDAINLGGVIDADVDIAASSLSVTYLFFRLWAFRVGGAIWKDKELAAYEIGAVVVFFAIAVIAKIAGDGLWSIGLLVCALGISAIGMIVTAPKTLARFEAEG